MTSRSEIAQQTERIKERTDIAAVIGGYIRLRKAGRGFAGLCPFHTEKTPSFHVNPARRSYRCFGCNAKGDVFDFIAGIERTNFTEARKLLANRAGIPAASELSAAERRTWLRQRKQDEADADRQDALIAFLMTRRTEYFRAYHRTRQHIVNHGVADSAGCDFFMDVCEISEARYLALDREIERLEGLSLPEFHKGQDGQALDLDSIARAWKQDRADAEDSCTVLVAMLTAAQIRDGDFPVQERAA